MIKEIFTTNPSLILKNKSIRKNIVNIFYYFGGTFLTFIISIFTLPIFSRNMELHDFAIMGYFTAVQAIIFPLFSMSLPFYYMAQYWRNQNGVPGYENLSLILNFLNIANAIIAVVAFLVLRTYFEVANVMFPLMPFILIVLANLFFEKFKTFYLLECRVQKQGLRFLLINVLQVVVVTGCSLFFVVALQGGAAGRMSGIFTGVLVAGIISMIILIREKKYRISLKLDRPKLKTALTYCFPLIIGAYAFYPVGNIDRLFLERIGNTQEYGYYSLGLIISGFAGTFFLALFQSFEPDLYKLIIEKKYKKYKVYVFAYLSIITIISLMFIFLSNYIVSFLTDGRYTHAATYANIFVIGILLMKAGGFFDQLFTAFGATRMVMWRNILIGSLSIVSYYIFIKNYQFSGANYSRILIGILYLFSGAILFFFNRKKIVHETIK